METFRNRYVAKRGVTATWRNCKRCYGLPSTPKCLQYKKNLARNKFRKNYKKYFPVHATPRGAHVSYKEKSVAATNSRKNYKKKISKKITGRELICKKFGVNGTCATVRVRSSYDSVIIADRNLSSTELESGKATGAFLQTPATVLDEISGPMNARFLSSTGLG